MMIQIQKFLDRKSKLKGLYHSGLECQIMVCQGEGIKKGNGFTDGINFWYNLRILKPNIRIKYDLEKYVESIGLSGWNFNTKQSEWVGFDFDSITGHKAGLTDSELFDIIKRASEVPWIEIRRSTSGKGIHFYIFLDYKEKVDTRKEHSLLAKAILKTLSGLLNFDFKSKVDGSGGILWIWSVKAKPEGFELIKPSTEKFSAIPKDWRTESKEFCGKIQPLTQNLKLHLLNADQQKLLQWFAKQKTMWWWDAELNMLVCHTFDLAKAHKELNCKGIFFTNSEGTDWPNDQNCFAFPIKNGAWIVRRHTPGCKEHPNWQLDKSGWTYCYFNKIPIIQDLVELFNGQENEKKEFIFTDKNNVLSLVKFIAPSAKIEFPSWVNSRKITIRPLKNAKVSIKFERSPDDPLVKGWIANRNNFERVIGIIEEEPEVITPDNLLRHVVTDGKDAGWFLNSKIWIQESLRNVTSALLTLGHDTKSADILIGQCVLNPWTLVNKPFEPEYPGGRQWNKYSPQFLFEAKEGDWSYWKQMLIHIGKNLTPAVEKNSWCQAYELTEGWKYLLYWIASLFQFPLEPLPYLFLYGPQLCGKSSFHEALAILINKGVVRANVALTNPQQFNKELAGAVLAVIEEINLRESKVAYNRIKDWVTSRTISIHEKGKTPFDLSNSCHWIHCSNHADYCPISFGDTRIVILEIEVPQFVKSREQFFMELRSQASAFLFQILNIKIPPPIDRLRIPVIDTDEKEMAQQASSNLVERFILEKCKVLPGHLILFSDFCVLFRNWLDQNHIASFEWSNIKIGRSIPQISTMPVKGKIGGDGQIKLGNISTDPNAKPMLFEYVKAGDRLVQRQL